jgi:hypothetical protein
LTSISSYFYANSFSHVAKPRSESVASSDAPSAAPISSIAASGVTSKADRPFSQVIVDARSALDVAYDKNSMHFGDQATGDQWLNKLGMKDFDRRTLNAIATNQGDQFSSDEVTAARWIMSKQIADVMQAAGSDDAAQVKAAIDFYDSVSPEEKSSLEWVQGRAAGQASYEMIMQAWGRTPEDVSTGNPIIELFVNAYRELSAGGNAGLDPRDMPSWKKGLELWHLHNDSNSLISWTL